MCQNVKFVKSSSFVRHHDNLLLFRIMYARIASSSSNTRVRKKEREREEGERIEEKKESREKKREIKKRMHTNES